MTTSAMRVALDAYPLFGLRTGVGTYVHQLVQAMVALPDPPQIVLPTVSLRSTGRAPDIAGATSRHLRLPFRAVQRTWDHAAFPPGEWLLGRADVFHATNFVAPPFRRTPVVTTLHDLSYERYPDAVDERVARYREQVPRTIARSHTVIAPAEATADDIAEFYGLDRHRVVAIHLGVDPAWLTAQPPDAASLRRHSLPDRFLIFVGAATHRKNIDLLLEAHAAARARHDGVPPLVIAGPPVPRLTDLPASGGDPDVITTGYLAEADLRRLVAGAVALLFPSRYEGFGLPVLEAFAAGTRVVASDLPVHREISGDHAVLIDLEVPDRDERTDRLAAAIVAAATHPVSAGEVAERREWAARFTWARTAEATRAVYEAVVG